jgi:two-component system response regulator AtoC
MPTLVGRSARMEDVRERIAKLGRSTAPVLLLGETGTGKEVVARAIHSIATEGPFVPIDCSVLGTLLESELFGHAKGAFTGAAGARAGLIEHAEGGTLLLDEIGTLSKGLQAKLLRALESGEVRRIGENDSRSVDVRFVAATNIDLKAATAAGEFRNDLYYRIHVHNVHMPPLRERTGDIPLLVSHFLSRNGRARNVTSCSRDALDVLMAYSFPGNVRQLEHIVQRAVATARGSELTPDDMPEELLAEPGSANATEGSVAAARDKAEREMIVATLGKHRGEIGAAARELQVSRTTMWRLMKKHSIDS